MKNHRALLVFVFIVLAGGLIVYTLQTPIYNGLSSLKLVPQPERFTELYFNNSTLLPREITPNQPISFTFTIHNVEGATTTYPYSVYFEYPNGARDIAIESAVTLGANASTSITVNHTFSPSDVNGMVVVNLTQLNQHIDFIVPNTNP